MSDVFSACHLRSHLGQYPSLLKASHWCAESLDNGGVLSSLPVRSGLWQHAVPADDGILCARGGRGHQSGWLRIRRYGLALRSLPTHVCWTLSRDHNFCADARWFTRDEVLNVVAHNKYKRERLGTMTKIAFACSTPLSSKSEKGKRSGRRGDGSELVGDVSSIFVPGPYAIAHNLVTSWLSKPSVHKSTL